MVLCLHASSSAWGRGLGFMHNESRRKCLLRLNSKSDSSRPVNRTALHFVSRRLHEEREMFANSTGN